MTRVKVDLTGLTHGCIPFRALHGVGRTGLMHYHNSHIPTAHGVNLC
jgi:hypothetical protein